MIKVGDIVRRKSYGGDILFRVKNINRLGKIDLVGLKYRIQADAELEDLQLVDRFSLLRDNRMNLDMIEEKVQKIKNNENKKSKKKTSDLQYMYKPVKVLHLDGDNEYLKLCMKYYKEFDLEVYGESVPEKEQPQVIVELLQKYQPDILIITGHDALTKGKDDLENIDNYRSSKYFIEAVKKARSYERNMDQLIIFAGACQSCYEEILKAGANFASSPERILIHAMDPVFISERIANTPIDKTLNIDEAIVNTFTGKRGVGGFETKGKKRIGAPSGKKQS